MYFQAVSGPKFMGLFSLNAGGIAIVCNFGRFWISSAVPEIRDQSLKWSKIDRNFACFWPPIFFLGGGSAPEFLEWDYTIQPDSDHVAKFQGDRSRDLGERVAKQKKDTSRSGRPNERKLTFLLCLYL